MTYTGKMQSNEKREIISSSAEETEKLGSQLGNELSAGDFVFLVGELGSGKTTLARGICKGVQKEDANNVRSPSFTIMLEYPGNPPIRHVDLYRIEGHTDFETIGLFDPAFSGITVVEWADRMPEDQRLNPIVVAMEDKSENERCVLIKARKSILNSMGL